MIARTSQGLTLYADESGNTGPHLLDLHQPFGVTAMVLLDSDQERHVADTIAAATSTGRVAREPKFTRMARTPYGRRMLCSVTSSLYACDARVFFSVTEKRYLASVLVAETFLDPVCSDKAPKIFLDPRERRLAANLVYHSCSYEVLSDFLAAARSADAKSLLRVGHRISSLLSLHPASEAPAVSHAIRNAADDAFDWSPQSGLPRLSERPTPHTFSFVPLLSVVDGFLRSLGTTVELVADEDAHFGPVLSQAFDLSRRPELFPGGVGAYGTAGPITHIGRRTEARSEREPGVQAADIMAGLIATAVRAAPEPQHLEGLEDAWGEVIGILRYSHPSSFWNTSERILESSTRTFDTLVPTRDNWWWTRLAPP